jgi:hypothetical protein
MQLIYLSIGTIQSYKHYNRLPRFQKQTVKQQISPTFVFISIFYLKDADSVPNSLAVIFTIQTIILIPCKFYGETMLDLFYSL